MKRWFFWAFLSMASAGAHAAAGEWNFRVFLDDKPIGYHRFVLQELGAQRELKSEARFEVKLLGFSAYRYTHDATERWNGDCLTSLTARTDDDGEQLAVGPVSPEGCVMSFAYWNPAILKRAQLLNAQTGKLDPVSIAALGDGRYRITGSKYPIDLWYSAGGRWIGLESTVAGGRRLRYRLQ